jgi:hypothetical protein
MIRLPSGDQGGTALVVGIECEVPARATRDVDEPDVAIRRRFDAADRDRFLVGREVGPELGAGSPTVPSFRPARSNQVICRRSGRAGVQARTPLAETEKDAGPPISAPERRDTPSSRMGRGSPDSSRHPASKASATSVALEVHKVARRGIGRGVLRGHDALSQLRPESPHVDPLLLRPRAERQIDVVSAVGQELGPEAPDLSFDERTQRLGFACPADKRKSFPESENTITPELPHVDPCSPPPPERHFSHSVTAVPPARSTLRRPPDTAQNATCRLSEDQKGSYAFSAPGTSRDDDRRHEGCGGGPHPAAGASGRQGLGAKRPAEGVLQLTHRLPSLGRVLREAGFDHLHESRRHVGFERRDRRRVLTGSPPSPKARSSHRRPSGRSAARRRRCRRQTRPSAGPPASRRSAREPCNAASP